MRAFTTYQPWCTLILMGAKPYEWRKKSFLDRRAYTNGPVVGERVALHAAHRAVSRAEVMDLLERIGDDDGTITDTGLTQAVARPLLERLRDGQTHLLTGCILGTVQMGEPRLASEIYGIQVADSDRGEFNYGWPMLDIRPFATPVFRGGHQGFWNWDRNAVG